MGKFNLDLGKFKKIHSSKDESILRHADGHEIKLSHKLLSPKMREQLHAIPMAEGGEVVSLDAKEPADASARKSGMTDVPMALAEGGQVANQKENYKDAKRKPASEKLDIEEVKEKPLKIEEIKNASVDAEPLQNFAEGGQAEDPLPPVQNSSPDPSAVQLPQVAAPQTPVVINVGQPAAPTSIPLPYGSNPTTGEAPKEQPQPVAPPQQAPEMAPAQSPQQPQQGLNDPFGTETTMQALQSGLGNQMTGITKEAQALGAQGKEQAAIQQQNITAAQQNQLTYKSHYDELEKERQHFMSDLKDQHIDPNHYMNSLNTGERVMKGIGLILGGIGGGLTHSENPALQMIQMQINNDIEAQKANMGKTQNLLGANMKQFGNMTDAMNMTRVMQNDIVTAQLSKAAAESADPLAKARAQQAIGKLTADNAQALGQLAMRRTILTGGQAGRIPPEQLIRGLIPQGEQKAYYDDLKTAQNTAATRDNLLGAFEKLTQLQSNSSRIGSPIQSNSQINAIMQPLLGSLSKETAGRFTELDAEYVKSLFPNFTDDAKTIAVKRNQLNHIISEKMHFPQLQSIGINAGSLGRFNQDSGAIKKIQLGPVK